MRNMAKTTKEFIKNGEDTAKLNAERQLSDPPVETPKSQGPREITATPDNPAVFDEATMGLRPV